MNPSVVIIGAGISGISAAHHLVANGITNVTILEATDRIGGRIWTENFGSGIIELGANWIHGCSLNNSVYILACQHGLLEKRIMLDRMEGHCYTSNGRAISRNISLKLWEFFRSLESEAAETGAGYGLCKTVAEFFHEKITEEIEKWPPSEQKDVEAVCTCFMNYLNFHCGGNLEYLPLENFGSYEEIPGGELKFPAGFSSLINILAKDLPNDCIKMKHPVSQIIWAKNKDKYEEDIKYKVEILCANKKTFFADHVIITVSLGYLKKHASTLFQPNLPSDKLITLQKSEFGIVNKLFLEYSQPFWERGKGGIKLAWSRKEITANTKKEWYKSIFAFDEVLNNPYVLVAWIFGEEAKFMETLSDEEIAKTCTKILRQFLGNPTIPEPKVVRTSKWYSNPFTLGSYTNSIFREQCQILAYSLPNKHRPRLMFAGEATHSRWFSTMHGARSAGLREAQKLLELYKQESEPHIFLN